MVRRLWSGLALLALEIWAENCHAQFGQPQRPVTVIPTPPPYSPYLNLTRRGNQAVNYYGLVRPEVEARTAIRGLQGQVAQLRTQEVSPQPGISTELPATGYAVRFLDNGNYFRGVSP